MVEDEAAVELGKVARFDARPLADPDSGRQAVDGFAGKRRVDDRTPPLHALRDVRSELDAHTVACDGDDVVECEPVAREDDRHEG
jgi:hypothetical protein